MPGLLRGVARAAVISGTATAVSNRVHDSRSVDGRSRTTRRPPALRHPHPEPAAAASMDTKISQLKELAQLKEQGVLSEAEFAAQKSRTLSL
ncbi:SHOCT domain-containing protein [Streptomyces sp. NPDC047461]|uniref:SHOCT domain-containing protein n=1 Tax=Streptomyces sp. NPDC047461 TaxID=3155619 RepID=UPI0033CA2342